MNCSENCDRNCILFQNNMHNNDHEYISKNQHYFLYGYVGYRYMKPRDKYIYQYPYEM